MLSSIENLTGQTLGGYTLDRLIGQGSVGGVFVAHRDGAPGEVVAVKVIVSPASRSPDDQAAFLQRWMRGIEIARQLNHPNILRIIAFGVDDASGSVYIVAPYLTGGSLAEQIARGPLPLDEASTIVSQVAEALDHAHAMQIAHLDVRPGNILRDQRGTVYLADFGMAPLIEAQWSRAMSSGQTKTLPDYRAPEQLNGQPAGRAADGFVLAMVAYQLITGQAPFQAPTFAERATQVLKQAPPAPRQWRPDLPEPAEAVILKALSKQPDQRFDSVGSFAQALVLGMQGTWPARSTAEQDAIIATPTQRRLATKVSASSSSGASATSTVVLSPPSPIVEDVPLRAFTPAPSPPPSPRRRRSAAMITLIVALLVAVALTAGIFLTLRGGQSTTGISRTPTTVPTRQPGTNPTAIPGLPPAATGFAQFASADGVYGLNYPGTWAISAQDVAFQDGTKATAETFTSPTDGASLQVIPLTQAIAAVQDEAVIQQTLQATPGVTAVQVTADTLPATYGTNTWTRITGSFTYKGKPQAVVALVAPHQTGTFLLVFFAPLPSSITEEASYFQPMVLSFTFFK